MTNIVFLYNDDYEREWVKNVKDWYPHFFGSVFYDRSRTLSLGFHHTHKRICFIRLRLTNDPLHPIERIIAHESVHSALHEIDEDIASHRYNKIWTPTGDLP